MRFAALGRLVATSSIGIGLLVLLQLRVPVASGDAAARQAVPDPTPVAAPAQPSMAANEGFAIERVSNAEEAVLALLRERYGIECYDSSDVTFAVRPDDGEELDKEIERSKLESEGWLEGGRWLGSSARAAQALGASEAFDDGGDIWMLVATDEGPAGVQLIPWRSETGMTAWSTANRVGECASLDPAYDEKQPPHFPKD